MTKAHDDKRVSAAYRDVAGERTPAALDEKVLAMAAAEARTRYGLARAWIRPVAWAATIGLSLAIVLELSRSPYPESANELAEPEPPARVHRQDAAAPAGSNAEAKSADSADSADRTDSGRPETSLRKRSEAAPAALDSDAVARELDSDTVPIVRQAEEQARMQAGEARAAAVLADRPDAAFTAEQPETTACGADDRASAETWFACIEALRETGREDLASQELDALREAFPDFRPPESE